MNDCTEEEARKRWCPHARVHYAGVVSVNRSSDGVPLPQARCVASDCMSWQNTLPGVSERGYCGLARSRS